MSAERNALLGILVFLAIASVVTLWPLTALGIIAATTTSFIALIAGCVAAGLAMLIAGDRWYERARFLRVKAKDMSIDKAKNIATIQLNAAPVRGLWWSLGNLFGLNTKPAEEQAIKEFEFSWDYYLESIDKYNSKAKRNTPPKEAFLFAQAAREALFKNLGIKEEQTEHTDADVISGHTTPITYPEGGLSTTTQGINTVRMIVNEFWEVGSPAELRHIKGLRTLLAKLLQREPALDTIEYEVQRNGERFFGMTFKRANNVTGYDLILDPMEMSTKKDAAQAVHRLLQKDIVSGELRGSLEGLPAPKDNDEELELLNADDKKAYRKIQDYYTQREAKTGKLTTPKIQTDRQDADHPDYHAISLFDPATAAANYQAPASGSKGQRGTVSYQESYAWKEFTFGDVALQKKLKDLFLSYTREINESDTKENLLKICYLVQDMGKIKKECLFRYHPDRCPKSGLNVNRIEMAQMTLEHAILGQGIYGEDLLKIRVFQSKEEFSQTPAQRQWVAAKNQVVENMREDLEKNLKIIEEGPAKIAALKQKTEEEKQRADEEKQRADEEKQRADESKQRADEANQRADQTKQEKEQLAKMLAEARTKKEALEEQLRQAQASSSSSLNAGNNGTGAGILNSYASFAAANGGEEKQIIQPAITQTNNTQEDEKKEQKKMAGGCVIS